MDVSQVCQPLSQDGNSKRLLCQWVDLNFSPLDVWEGKKFNYPSTLRNAARSLPLSQKSMAYYHIKGSEIPLGKKNLLTLFNPVFFKFS